MNNNSFPCPALHTFTFNQGLKLLLHAGASRAVVRVEGLHPEQVGCPRGQLTDLHRVLLQQEHRVGSHIQIIILKGKRHFKDSSHRFNLFFHF